MIKKMLFISLSLFLITSCAKDVDDVINGETQDITISLEEEKDLIDAEDIDIDDKGIEIVKVDDDNTETKPGESKSDKSETNISKSSDKQSSNEPAPGKPVTEAKKKPAEPAPSKPAPSKPAEPEITWIEEVSYKVVNFDTENINDNSLNKGDNKVKRNGVTGQDKIIVSIKLSDGVEVSRSQKAVRTLEPISQQVLIGTYVEPPKPPAQPSGQVVTSGGQVQVMVDLINQDRASRNLNRLSISGELARGASIRAEELMTSFSHTRPDGQPFYTVSDLAYGENVSYGYDSGASAHEGFMNSPGHKDNILSTRWNTVGIGMIVSGDGTTYWAVLFGE